MWAAYRSANSPGNSNKADEKGRKNLNMKKTAKEKKALENENKERILQRKKRKTAVAS